MKKLNKFAVIYLLCIFTVCGIGFAVVSIVYPTSDKSFVIKNNDTRDYDYEHYCDSIYEVNPDYYLDVLVETDEYQDYIEKHGEWWTN